MSSNGDDATPVGREVAYRLFAAEYDDATLSHAESDEERAPNYVITPTGARINRLFVVGTLTEVTPVNDEMVRARVVDPTGAFVVYAGQYQPEALAFLERAEPPAFVAVTGKARTFQPDDAERVYTSIRPESVATVDADTRDRWVVDAAERTEARIETYAAAAPLEERGDALTTRLLEADVPEGPAKSIPLAREHYGTTPAYLEALRTLSREAVRVVAGERDQVDSFDRAPDDSGDATFADLAAGFDRSIPATSTEGAESTAETDAGASITATETTSATDETSAATAEPADVDASTETETEALEASANGGDDSGEAAVDAESTAAAAEPATNPDASDDEPAEAIVDESTDVAGSESAASDGSTETADEPAETADESATPVDEPADSDGELAAGMYEMDDDEREELEAEFGAEFTTGAEVEDAGEADIEAPAAETEAEPAAGAEAPTEPDATTESETDEADDLGDFEPTSGGLDKSDDVGADSDAETGADAEQTTDEPAAEEMPDEPAEDVDVQDAAVDAMRDLDEGDGADRGAVIEAVVERTGADEATVESAIADALMGGQCYEPDDETLKPI